MNDNVLKLLITGSYGFIGRRLVKSATNRGHSITKYDIIDGHDITNSLVLRKHIKSSDIVINLAAIGDLYDVNDNVDLAYKINVLGAINVGKICLELDKRLIHASTCCVYGKQNPDKLINEKTEPHPTDTYAIQKFETDKELLALREEGLKLILARLATAYGGEMRNSQVIKRFVLQALRKEPILIHGDGSQKRTYTHVDDIVKGLIVLAESKPKHVIYNLSSCEPISVLEIVKKIEQICDEKLRVIHGVQRKGQFFNQNVSSLRMEEEFGWQVEIPISEGIRRCVGEISHDEWNSENQFQTDIVPCIHRIHSDKLVKPQHTIQKDIGFSLSVKNIKEQLLNLMKESVNSSLLVTFDDGYRDVLLLRDFFQKNKNLKPAVFISNSIITGEVDMNWFDKFYCILGKMTNGNLNDFLKSHESFEKEEKDTDISQMRKRAATGSYKKKLKLLNHQSQHRELESLIEKYQITINESDKNIYLTAKDIRDLINEGWFVGSHSRYHYDNLDQNSSRIKYELETSLEEILNCGGRSWLAFPDGKYDKKIYIIGQKVGYTKFFSLANRKDNVILPEIIYRTIW